MSKTISGGVVLALVLTALVIMAPPNREAQAVNAAGTYVNFYWPGEGYASRTWDWRPLNDASPSAYFYAHQQGVVNGDGFYVGAQTRHPGNDRKMLLFSWWRAKGARAANGGWCQTFSGEGEGYSCRRYYDWQPNTTYRYRVEKVKAGWWQASITNLSTGVRTNIGKIQVPRSWGGLDSWSVVWTEHFINPERTCEELPFSAVRWYTPVSGSGVRPRDAVPEVSQNECSYNSRITRLSDGSWLDEEGIARKEVSTDG